MRRAILTAMLAITAMLAGCGDRSAGQPDPGSPVESAVPRGLFGHRAATPAPVQSDL